MREAQIAASSVLGRGAGLRSFVAAAYDDDGFALLMRDQAPAARAGGSVSLAVGLDPLPRGQNACNVLGRAAA